VGRRGRFGDVAAEGGRTLLIVQIARLLVRQQFLEANLGFLFRSVMTGGDFSILGATLAMVRGHRRRHPA
jgi:hypothetical protein